MGAPGPFTVAAFVRLADSAAGRLPPAALAARDFASPRYLPRGPWRAGAPPGPVVALDVSVACSLSDTATCGRSRSFRALPSSHLDGVRNVSVATVVFRPLAATLDGGAQAQQEACAMYEAPMCWASAGPWRGPSIARVRPLGGFVGARIAPGCGCPAFCATTIGRRPGNQRRLFGGEHFPGIVRLSSSSGTPLLWTIRATLRPACACDAAANEHAKAITAARRSRRIRGCTWGDPVL
jgi:hypothetical protein